jgi:hypothetical protein
MRDIVKNTKEWLSFRPSGNKSVANVSRSFYGGIKAIDRKAGW